MEMNNYEFDEIFNVELLMKYGYFNFKKTRKFQDEYIESNVFSSEIWSMEEFYHFLENDLSPYLKERLNPSNYKYIKENSIISRPIEYFMYKTRLSNRKFKYINFINYYILANYLVDNKEELRSLFCEDRHSISKFIYGSYKENQMKIEKNIAFKNKKHVLKTDITQFYPSIYTHTIPWVFMGKKSAKISRNTGFSNKLDTLIRSGQDGESKGIPIGNTISRIIAEAYLMKIDQELEKYKFHRFSDDYRFYFNDVNKGDEILILMSKKYFENEIHLNESKIKTIEYPDVSNQVQSLTNYAAQVKFWNVKNHLDLARYLYDYMQFYYVLRKEETTALFYFELDNILKYFNKKDENIVIKLFKNTDVMFELINIFLLDYKYLQYFLRLVDKYKLLKYEKTKSIFRQYEVILNKKLKYFLETNLTFEASYILTLNLQLDNCFSLDKVMLKKYVASADSFNALLAFKILLKYHRANIYSLKNIINDRFKTNEYYIFNDKLCIFKDEDFVFMYEIFRMCKAYEREKKTIINHVDLYRIFEDNTSYRVLINGIEETKQIDIDDLYYHIYKEMIYLNVKFIKI